MPLLFLYAVTWFVESVMLWDLSFSLLFYYPVNNELSTLYLSGMGLFKVAASIIFLNRLGDRWKGKLFRIA